MTDPTLPSRARARELADCEADLAAYKPDNLPLNVTEWTEDFNASKDAAAEARDRAAILAAYASGVLVPAGEVAAMRERARETAFCSNCPLWVPARDPEWLQVEYGNYNVRAPDFDPDTSPTGECHAAPPIGGKPNYTKLRNWCALHPVRAARIRALPLTKEPPHD